MKTNFICYLNGVSSSGKSSISKELLKLIKVPTIYLSLDNIHENLCDEFNNDKWELYDKEVLGLHKMAVVWYEMGFNVIIDNVLETKYLKDDAFKILPYAFFIGIIVSLDTLIQREKKRGRGHFKLIKYQFKKVHKDLNYDLTFSSDTSTAKEIANSIIKFLQIEGNKGS